MRPDLAQVIFVPVEHRTSIVYATHDSLNFGKGLSLYVFAGGEGAPFGPGPAVRCCNLPA
jgi:hypothetical protein